MKKLILIIDILILLCISCSLPSIKKTSLFDNKSKIKIVHISDIHFDHKKKLFNDAVVKINDINPDILFITGDFLNNKNDIENFIGCFGKLHNTYPKYAILGNWEHWAGIDINSFSEKLSKINIKLLINDFDVQEIRNRRIYIYGMDDYSAGKPSFLKFQPNNEKTVIILEHCPILFDVIQKEEKINNTQDVLVLSGHTHGGQITFFGIPIIKPEGSGKYTAGIYKNNNVIMNVNKGLGNSTIDFRLFSDPTIDIIEL